MLVRINGLPIQEVPSKVAYVADTVSEIAFQPLNVELTYGSHHLVSADLNPLNAPHHVLEGIQHLGHFFINLF